MNTPGMKDREIEFIPDRLIEEPVVFRGMTDTEVVAIITVSIVFWIPVCVGVLAMFDGALFGVAIGFALAIATLILAGKQLQSLKRKMPDGLHVVYLKKRAQEIFSFVNFGYIETSQSWDIKRSKEVERVVFESEEE